jgi:hypothetical protein
LRVREIMAEITRVSEALKPISENENNSQKRCLYLE